MLELGTLQKIDPRAAWETEDRHFTPWLASDQNISLLSEVLGLELEVEAQEKQVGPFRADILCKDVQSDALVLIENQLEKTDHKHLGQLMTYASGLKTAYVVWIADRFQDEHRAALDWLNEITDDAFRFFGLEVELWKIGDSAMAPKFNVVSRPNEWSGDAKDGLKGVDQGKSETKLLQKKFWLQFSDYLDAEKSIVAQKANPQHWLNISVGKAGVKIVCTVNTNKNRLGVELYMYGENSSYVFEELEDQKEEVESDLGFAVDWQPLPEKKATRIAVYRNDSVFSTEQSWQEYNAWLADHVASFREVFKARLNVI